MPRQARIDAPGALHHVIVRGINRKKIFKDDHDRHRMRRGGRTSDYKLLAYKRIFKQSANRQWLEVIMTMKEGLRSFHYLLPGKGWAKHSATIFAASVTNIGA